MLLGLRPFFQALYYLVDFDYNRPDVAEVGFEGAFTEVLVKRRLQEFFLRDDRLLQLFKLRDAPFDVERFAGAEVCALFRDDRAYLFLRVCHVIHPS